MPRESLQDSIKRAWAVAQAAGTLASVAHENRISYKEAASLLRASMTRLAKDERASKMKSR